MTRLPLYINGVSVKTVDEAWLEYRRDVVPKGAEQAQLEGTEMAFYAGASSVLSSISEVSDDRISEDEGVGVIEYLMREVKRNAAKWAARAARRK